jgi:O-antigen/teichoic acid export membrane protein
MPSRDGAASGGFRMGRIGRQSVVYGVGALAGKAVAFLMLPLYTRYLTTSDYGTLQLIDMTMEVVSIVAGSRLSAGIFHYYHKAETEIGRAEVVATSLMILGLAFTAAGLVALLAAPWLSQLIFHSRAQTDLIRIAAISLALQSLLIVPTAHLQLLERPGTLVTTGLVKLVIQLTLNVVLLVGLHLGAMGVLLSTLVSNVVVGVWLTVLLVRRVGLRFSPTAAREIVRFGAPFIGTHLAKFVVTYGDRYVLQAAWGTGVVGVYGLAYQFGFLLATLGDGPYRTVWEPMRFEVARRPDRDEVYARAFIHLNLVQVTMGVAISLFVPEFLRVMATPPFYQAGNWVPIIVAAYLGQSWSLFLNTGLFIKERTSLITWATWLGAAAAIAGYVALIPPLGGMGAALATLLSFIVLFWAVYRYSQREWPIAYRWGPVLRMIAAAAVIVGAAFLLPPLPLLAAIAAKTALLAAYLGVIWLPGVLTVGERDLVRLLLKSPREGLAALRR